MKKLQFFWILLFFIGFRSNAQTYTLILINRDIIVGEIKSMNKKVLGIETDYSGSDFKMS